MTTNGTYSYSFSTAAPSWVSTGNGSNLYDCSGWASWSKKDAEKELLQSQVWSLQAENAQLKEEIEKLKKIIFDNEWKELIELKGET